MAKIKYGVGICLISAISLVVLMIGCRSGDLLGSQSKKQAAIIIDSNASYMETLAAKEMRRYIYVRTGELLPLEKCNASKADDKGTYILVARKDRLFLNSRLSDENVKNTISALEPQGYCLKTVQNDSGNLIIVAGGDDAGTLYGAYRFAEQLGVRFYLHGDIIPDKKIAFEPPHLDIIEKPLFNLRGILPFHDFPEGPDWWNTDDYKAIISQLSKLRMNFIGLHTYPEGVGPEPTVWIGVDKDIMPDGRVKFSSRSSYANMARPPMAGYVPLKTSEFHFGGSQLFEEDDFGSEVMKGIKPFSENPDERNELFNRTAAMLNQSFTLAHKIGVKTCVGTETPLAMPHAVKERLKHYGKDANDPATVRDVYEGIFKRIKLAYPVDYYWLWMPETWTCFMISEKQVDAAQKDLLIAANAAKNISAPFTLATCGWVLGPPKDRALFDNILPKEMPFSCISRGVGKDPVERQFADVQGRPKWAIPWFEDDPGMISPQLWAGRMRMDAVDALKYGCTGLMGIHWRTRILSPNIAALAQAGWDQSDFNIKMDAEIPTSANPVIVIGGQEVVTTDDKISDTNDSPLYQSVKANLSAYRFWLPNGKYSVTLKFCEMSCTEPNKRVFDVRLQDKYNIKQLDIFAKVGLKRALDYTFDDVLVTDNMLNIDFFSFIDLPTIAAISIEGQTNIKINCGGGQYQDYVADVTPIKLRRSLPVEDFYNDWAVAEFGPEIAERAAAIFSGKDGKLHEPSSWIGHPGAIGENKKPWSEVSAEYTFVDDFAALENSVSGAANRERFEYWLNNFKYMKTMANVGCLLDDMNDMVKDMNSVSDQVAKKDFAIKNVLPVRKELAEKWAQMCTYLISSISNVGEMGTLANIEQYALHAKLLTRYDGLLEQVTDAKLPDDTQLLKDYRGRDRLFVPTVRTSIDAGESLKLKAIILSAQQPAKATLHWRHIGQTKFQQIPLLHIARGVYEAAIPAAEINSMDFEYFIDAKVSDANILYWPSSAPKTMQTVLVMSK